MMSAPSSTLVKEMDGILSEKKYAYPCSVSNELRPLEALDLKTSERDIDTAIKTIATIEAFFAISMIWQQASGKRRDAARTTKMPPE
jgi:hypothetical protein